MNTKILLIGLGVAALTSCSTAYKSGQTPDDVYFSPAKEREEYVDVESRQDRYYPQQNSNNYDYNTYRDDRFLRMRIANRSRWQNYNDLYLYDYNFGGLGYSGIGYDYNLSNPWNSYFYWNNFYNPYTRYNYFNPGYYGYSPGYYHGGGVIGIPAQPSVVSRPRSYNPAAYNNRNYSNSQMYVDGKMGTTRPTFNNANAQYNNSNSSSNARYSNGSSNTRYNNTNRTSNNNNGSAVGNAMRRVFDNSGNNDNSYRTTNNSRNDTYTPPQSRSTEAPVRTYTPSSSSSSSSSSGSSGGGSSRPSRF